MVKTVVLEPWSVIGRPLPPETVATNLPWQVPAASTMVSPGWRLPALLESLISAARAAAVETLWVAEMEGGWIPAFAGMTVGLELGLGVWGVGCGGRLPLTPAARPAPASPWSPG